LDKLRGDNYLLTEQKSFYNLSSETKVTPKQKLLTRLKS
jgi:hypothetical protein